MTFRNSTDGPLTRDQYTGLMKWPSRPQVIGNVTIAITQRVKVEQYTYSHILDQYCTDGRHTDHKKKRKTLVHRQFNFTKCVSLSLSALTGINCINVVLNVRLSFFDNKSLFNLLWTILLRNFNPWPPSKTPQKLIINCGLFNRILLTWTKKRHFRQKKLNPFKLLKRKKRKNLWIWSSVPHDQTEGLF